MIKVENIEVMNFEGAIRGMRNALNSWDKSDSYKDGATFRVGKEDLTLMKRLYAAGPSHRKYLRQIFVSMDITAPTYWNAEFDTYKIGVTRNSCSFMHTGLNKPFEITDFSISDDRVYEVLSPVSKEKSKIVYPYETDKYKPYTGKNGRTYRIYKNGRVVAEKFEYVDTMNRHRVLAEKECTPSITPHGYYEINLGGKNGKKWMLHRLIATVWIDNPNQYMTVNHKDGNKGNNCVENLEWTTLQDNIRDGYVNGLYENGKSLHARYLKWKNGHSIFSDPWINKMIVLDREECGMTCYELAEKYGITVNQANNIISGQKSEYTDLFLLCFTYERIIAALNSLREQYMLSKDTEVFQQIRRLLPSGYNQRYTITMNYENVVSMIEQRSNHKLSEWLDFCDVLRSLPCIKEIMEESK